MKFLIFFLAFMSIVAIAHAQNTTQWCLDNSTLFSTTSMVVQIGNNVKDITINESFLCQSGCDSVTNKCIPDAGTRWLVVIAFVVVVAVISLYFGRRYFA